MIKMLEFEQPKDVLSASVYNILNTRKDEKYIELVSKWNKKIVFNIKDVYPVTVIFNNGNISYEVGAAKKANLKVTMTINTMFNLAYGRKGLIGAVLTRKMRIKGFYKMGTLLKFYRIFYRPMKKLVAEPNTKYYEMNKTTR